MNMKQQEQKWQTESDVSTMISYHEMMKDKARYGRAMALAKEKRDALAKATGDMEKMSYPAYSAKRKAASKPDHYGGGMSR